MTWSSQVASQAIGTSAIGFAMTNSPLRRWVTASAQCQTSTTPIPNARSRSTVRSREPGTVATRPSSHRLAARSGATGHPNSTTAAQTEPAIAAP
jgi:hypothetical protein